jgi:protein TIF31
MIQGAYGPEASLPVVLEYRKLAELVHGADSVPVGQAEQAIGQVYALCSDITNALEHIKLAHAVLSVHLGDEAKDVQEAHQFIRLVETSVAQQAAEAKARDEQIAKARADGLNKKFPQLMANAALRSRVGANGIGSSSAVQDKQPETVIQRQHGQKADLPLDDLVNYITGSSSSKATGSKASRKRKPSP